MADSRIPPQIARLILLTALILGVYWVAHVLLTPRSFGQYGHYRGAALDEIRSREPAYAGKKACEECHAEEAEALSKFPHKTLSCEVCHGMSKEHAADPDKATTGKMTDPSCLRCHEPNVARPEFMKQVDPKEHYPGEKCTECHIPHKPTETP